MTKAAQVRRINYGGTKPPCSPMARLERMAIFWRKVRDSNPGRLLNPDGFQDRCNKPLCQLSKNGLHQACQEFQPFPSPLENEGLLCYLISHLL